jgi:hypothetical protein
VLGLLTVDVAPGSYQVGWAQYEPDAQTAFEIVELRRAAI